MRDAISLLDQLASSGEKITLGMAQIVLGTATNQLVVDMIEAIVTRKADAGLNLIHTALDSGSDPRQFARQVVDYLRGLMLARLGNADQVEATTELRQQMVKQAARFNLAHLTDTLRLFNAAASETRGGWQPGLLLELAFAESLEEKSPATSMPIPAASAPPSPVQSWKDEIKTPPAATSSSPMVPPDPARPAGGLEAASPPIRIEPTGKDALKSPSQPSPASTPAQVSPGTLTLQQILDQWTRIRAQVKRVRGPTEALLNSCKLQAVKNGVLVMGFSSELIKSKMESNDNLTITRSAIKEVLGTDIPITCMVMGSKIGENPTESEVEGDGMIRTALNLGGKIVQKE
jgi:DNA polymerase-3 subunit gamma/tau